MIHSFPVIVIVNGQPSTSQSASLTAPLSGEPENSHPTWAPLQVRRAASYSCPSQQPSCALHRLAPDGPERFETAHADYASHNRGGGRKAGEVALKTSQSAALTAPLSGEPENSPQRGCPYRTGGPPATAVRSDNHLAPFIGRHLTGQKGLRRPMRIMPPIIGEVAVRPERLP